MEGAVGMRDSVPLGVALEVPLWMVLLGDGHDLDAVEMCGRA